jgi:hypothetical protein
LQLVSSFGRNVTEGYGSVEQDVDNFLFLQKVTPFAAHRCLLSTLSLSLSLCCVCVFGSYVTRAQNFIAIFSAGNNDLSEPGQQVASPGLAKNGITVGACMNANAGAALSPLPIISCPPQQTDPTIVF